MKKLFVMAALVLAAATVNAQAGKFYVGTCGISSGGADYTALMTGFSSQGDETAWGLAPEIGYNLSDNLTIGLGIGYTSFGDDSDMFGVNPYVRWYGWKSGDFSVYLQGNIEYAKFNYIDGDDNKFGINVAPGIAYSFTEKWGINATFGVLGYEKYKSDDDGAFGLALNSGLAFGLTYTF